MSNLAAATDDLELIAAAAVDDHPLDPDVTVDHPLDPDVPGRTNTSRQPSIAMGATKRMLSPIDRATPPKSRTIASARTHSTGIARSDY